jgi:hypothetical protein
MRRTIAPIALACAVASCPAPTTIDSVDGLAGGKLTSPIEAPAATFGDVTTAAATVDSLAASGEVTAANVTASASMTAQSITADEVSAERLTLRGYAVYGTPLGTVDYHPNLDGDGYRTVDGLCRVAFGEVSHVCGAEEVMTAYRAGVDPPDTMHQAAVVTQLHYTTLRVFTGDETRDNFVNVDDCDGWTNNQTFVFGGGSRVIRGAVTNTYPTGHTYLALEHDEGRDLWRLAPPFTTDNCSQVKLACCG